MSDVEFNPEWFPQHDIPPGGRSGFVRVDGRQVHYLEWGRGGDDGVVCLHGGGQTAYMFEELGSALRGDGFHVFAPDLPNHGDSGRTDDMSRQSLAATVGPTLDEMGMDRVHVVGASLGGITAITFAAAAPERVTSISLIDIGHQLEDEGVKKIIDFMRAHESFATLDEAAEAIGEYLPQRRRVDPSRLTRNLRQRPDGRWEWKHSYGRRLRAAEETGGAPADGTGWRTLVEGMDDDLRALSCPVLVLRGGKSDVLSGEGAEAVTGLIPDARLEVVTDAGHLAAGDNPDSTVGIIRSFLTEVRRR
ncbi:MAG TPA: alpha/beta hydrolase [Acidimicrobiales bacterium]